MKEARMTTTAQSHQIIAALATNTDWTKVRFDSAKLQERLVRDPERAAAHFVAFLNNGARIIIDEPKVIQIDRSVPFDPATFKGLGDGWTIWKGPIDGDGLTGEEEQDARSLALTEFDLSKMCLETCLKKGETSLEGEEKLARLKKDHSAKIRPDAKIFLTFWENQHLIPLQWEEKTNGGTTYVFFDGTILRRPNGSRCVLYLCWRDGLWQQTYLWLGLDIDACSRSALLACGS